MPVLLGSCWRGQPHGFVRYLGMPKFTKGHPGFGGRKRGEPTRGQVEVQQLARDLLSDPAYLANLRERLIHGRCAPQVECKLYAYAFGEPPRDINLNANLRGLASVVHEHVSRLELGAAPSANTDPSEPDVH